MLRDRIVCGTNYMQTQKRLLAEKNLIFAKDREIVLAFESAVQGTRDIQTPFSNTVHKVADGNKLNSYKCYRCGKSKPQGTSMLTQEYCMQQVQQNRRLGYSVS